MEYLTAKEIAEILQFSSKHVITLFEHYPGVVVFEKQKSGKRRYRELRIPKAVFDRFVRERRNG